MKNLILNLLAHKHLMICIFVFVLFYLLFYPSKFVTIDENNYLSIAHRMFEGDLRFECSGYEGEIPIFDSTCIYKYNIGTSLFLLLIFVFPWINMFVVPLLAYVLSVCVFYCILLKIRLDTRWIYLFASFPVFVFHSRTILSEIFSLLFLLVVYLLILNTFFTDKDWTKQRFGVLKVILLVCVIWLGVFVRYSNVIVFVVLTGYALFFSKFSFRSKVLIVFELFVFSLPFLILFFGINNYLYLSPFRTGYFYTGEEKFSLSNILFSLPRFLFYLNLYFPLMLFFGVRLSKKFLVNTLPFLTILIFYSITSNTLFRDRWIDIITGIRFVAPFVPLLMLNYFDRLEDFVFFRSYRDKIFKVLVVFCILLCFSVSFVHQSFLHESKYIYHTALPF